MVGRSRGEEGGAGDGGPLPLALAGAGAARRPRCPGAGSREPEGVPAVPAPQRERGGGGVGRVRGSWTCEFSVFLVPLFAPRPHLPTPSRLRAEGQLSIGPLTRGPIGPRDARRPCSPAILPRRGKHLGHARAGFAGGPRKPPSWPGDWPRGHEVECTDRAEETPKPMRQSAARKQPVVAYGSPPPPRRRVFVARFLSGPGAEGAGSKGPSRRGSRALPGRRERSSSHRPRPLQCEPWTR